MLAIYYGENRVDAERALRRSLGENYEVLDGETLELADLPSIFQGVSLFETEKRQILIKDVSTNTAVWEKLADYAETEHDVICWELKLDKRSAGYRKMQSLGVTMQEFLAQKPPEAKLVFNILDTALRDGEKALKMVEQIELQQDPYMFFGLLVTQLLKKYETTGGGARERRRVKELAKLDLQMKSTTFEPWQLIKVFLLRVKDI